MGKLRWGARGSVASILAAMAAVIVGHEAAAFTLFDDVIFTRGRSSGDDFDAPHNIGDFVPTDLFGDIVGAEDQWNTHRIVVTRTSSSIAFDIFTNKDPGEPTSASQFNYADLAITLATNNAVTGLFNNWSLGVDLGLITAYGPKTTKLYSLNNPNWLTTGDGLAQVDPDSDWQTSDQAFGKPQAGNRYGSRFRAAHCDDLLPGGDAAVDTLPADCSVKFAVGVNILKNNDGVDPLGNVALQVTALVGDIDGATTQIHIEIANTTFTASGIGEKPFDIFWGTSMCGNDAIWGTVPGPPHVPEPAMLGLFGLGLVALGLARRRRTA